MGGFGGQTAATRHHGQFAAGVHKQAGDKDRLGHLAVFVGCGLEGDTWCVGEAVQVEAVVPVGATDQGQTMRPQPPQCVMEAAQQVVVERRLGAGLVVVGHRLVQDALVAGLLQIG